MTKSAERGVLTSRNIHKCAVNPEWTGKCAGSKTSVQPPGFPLYATKAIPQELTEPQLQLHPYSVAFLLLPVAQYHTTEVPYFLIDT